MNSKKGSAMKFEILVNDTFLNLIPSSPLSPISNKHVLSLANDFENGEWRFNKFQNFIWDNIAETSLSQKERMSLVNHSHSLLTSAAVNLRLTDAQDDISKGSELAEVVLYGIMKEYYNALPVVPKIFYKQNSQDNAKGADSVHIVVTDNDFSLWFGEAKFYNSIDDSRLGTIVESIGNSLSSDKMRKENSIITNVSDLDSLPLTEPLRESIKKALSPQLSLDGLKMRIHIPILLLHECGITKSCIEMSQKYREDLVNYHKDRASAYFKKQIEKIGSIFKYEDIKFHIILLPVPSKKLIVDKFIANVKHYKEQNK
jgi:hypothetical protein